jgi:predicted MFS family arabinose efflux permease
MSEAEGTTSQAKPGAIWRDINFDRYWSGHALSAFGDRISALGLPLIAVVLLDASPGQVGLLTAAIWAPSLLSLFVGTWVDKHRHQQRLLIVSDLFQCAAIATVPITYGIDHLSMPVLYGCALALGAGGVLYNTSYPSFFVRLVPKDQYVAANSVLSTTMSIAGLAGPAVAGLLIDALSAPDALLVDAATFLFSAIAVSTVHTRKRPPVEPAMDPAEPYLTRLRLGVAYLRKHPYLRASLLASTMMNIAAFIIQAVLILFATRHLHMTPGQIGLAFSIGAIGGLLGAITAAPIAARIGAGRTIAVGVGLNVLPFAGLAIAGATPDSGTLALAAAEFISAWAIMLFDINNNALRAVVTADDMRGRVSGAYATVNYGSRPIGALLGGWSATAFGVPTTLIIAGAIGTLASSWIIRSPIADVRAITDL